MLMCSDMLASTAEFILLLSMPVVISLLAHLALTPTLRTQPHYCTVEICPHTSLMSWESERDFDTLNITSRVVNYDFFVVKQCQHHLEKVRVNTQPLSTDNDPTRITVTVRCDSQRKLLLPVLLPFPLSKTHSRTTHHWSITDEWLPVNELSVLSVLCRTHSDVDKPCTSSLSVFMRL